MNRQDELFQAIEKISRSVAEAQSYSKIVKGVVVSETVNSDGAYDIEYLTSRIKAYPQNQSLKYKAGEQVLILLPNGQLSDKKIIINTAEGRPDSMPDLDDAIQGALDSVVSTGRNYITAPKEPVSLNKDKLSHPITIDEIFYKHYMASQSHMRVRARVNSQITRSGLPSNFSYGIKITITYSDNSTRDFNFNYLNMEGNVYGLVGNVQDLVFEIPATHKPIKAVGELYLLNPGSNANDYVEFSELKLELLSDVLADIIAGRRYSVRIYSDSGSVFDSSDTKNVKLICQIISDTGIDVDPWGLSFDYEWYSITFDNEGNKIKPSEPFSTSREVVASLAEMSSGTKYYECDVYPKMDTLIKKLDI